jgi:phosphatidylserine decarboxylase
MMFMLKTLKLYYHYCLPKKFLTWIAFILANNQTPWLKNYLIKDFIKKHDVNMLEAEQQNPYAYRCFNDFFTRKLAHNVRTIAKNRYVCPADGVISQAGTIANNKLLQAKGIDYSLESLIQEDNQPCKDFLNGSFVTIYLSPKDYHRIHMPIDGEIYKQTYIPGNLYSVQPFTTENIPNIFSGNERLVLHINTQSGPMIMVLVGATIVGCIGTAWQGDISKQKNIKTTTYGQPITLKKGDELGYFKLGSTVIMVLSKDAQPRWIKSLETGTDTRLGEALAD